MLEEYKETLAAIAGLITVAQMFSGVFLCKTIYQNSSTKNVPSMPFVGGTAISFLFLQHGLLLKDKATGIVNFIGIGINFGYLLFYYAFSTPAERSDLFKKLGISFAIIATLVGYANLEDPELAKFRFGVIVTVLLILLISMPLFQIKTIVRKKDSSIIPLPMVITGTAMGVTWLLYGLAAHQDFIVFQNLIGLILTVPQLILCYLYPAKNVVDKKNN